MTVNELEASSLVSLIDAFSDFKKGGSLICFLESCKKMELINEHGKFNEGDRKLRAFRKKLKALIVQSEKLNK